MRRKSVALAVGIVALLLGGNAAADETPVPPPEQMQGLHFRTPFHVTTDGGAKLNLPPGYYLPEPTWNVVDAEMRRLQDTETKLTAENKSLRASASEGPGWGTVGLIAAAILAGTVGGAWAF